MQITGQLGESETMTAARNKLELENLRLEDLKHQQQSVEWEIDDLSSKLAGVEEELYSGRTRNPKELSNLQHEADILKANRSQLEDKALESIDRVEQATGNIAALNGDLKEMEAEWRKQQKRLSTDLKQLKTVAADLGNKRQLQLANIDPQTVEAYQELKKQRKTAISKVEQGVCGGCRISLPVTELHQIRGGNLVRCSSCGRILFLA